MRSQSELIAVASKYLSYATDKIPMGSYLGAVLIAKDTTNVVYHLTSPLPLFKGITTDGVGLDTRDECCGRACGRITKMSSRLDPHSTSFHARPCRAS